MKIENAKGIEDIIKDYKKQRKGIENKYKQNKKETNTMKELRNINAEIATSNLRIKNLQEELSKVSIKDKDLVEEYANSIKNIQHGYQDEKTGKRIKGIDDYLKDKDKLEKQVVLEMQSQREEDLKRENDKELELSELDGKTTAKLTQKGIKIDVDIERIQVLLQAKHIEMEDFEYQYEEYEYTNENGDKVTGRTVKNGEDFKKIQDECRELQDNLTDLRQAKKLCEEELDKFKQKYEKKMEDFSNAWNATKEESGKNEPRKNESGKNEPRKNESGKNEPSKNESGRIGSGKSESGKNEPSKNESGKNGSGKSESGKNGPGKDESGKNRLGKNEPVKNGPRKNEYDKNKWSKQLTEEQIDELKAELIKPGDQEYYMYLINHGINEKRIEWNPLLTREQMDELKAELIEPGDQEYYMYLRSHGINEKIIDNNQNQTSQNESGNNGPTQSESGNNGPIQNGSSNNGPTQSESGNNGPTQNESSNNGTTQSESGNNGPTQNGSSNNGPTQSESGNSGPTQNESSNNGPTQNESSNNGPTQNGSSNNGPTQSESGNNGPTQSESGNNGPTQNESSNNGPTQSGLGSNNYKNQWHPQLTEDQINELKAEGIKPGDQEYSKYLKNHGIDEQKEKKLPMVIQDKYKLSGIICNIHIGREGTIEYDGQKYEISKEEIKEGVNIKSFSQDELDDYLKKELSMKNETAIKTFKDLVAKDLIDMTVVHAISSTNMEEDKKRDVITRYVHKVISSEQGKEDSSNIDLEYDMESLSKSNFWHKIFKKEVNAEEKISICRSAVIANRRGIAKMKGEYKPSFTERIAGWIKRKENMAFPVKNVERAHTVALEYNNMAYDKDGNKVLQRELQKKFKERMEYNKGLDVYDEDRLSFREKSNLKGLVKEHDENEEEEEK